MMILETGTLRIFLLLPEISIQKTGLISSFDFLSVEVWNTPFVFGLPFFFNFPRQLH